jgi:hypothetical protein
MNRSFEMSVNEGSSGVGAIHIHTPTGRSGSWMLSCLAPPNRPFNNNDKTALVICIKID